MAFLEGGSPSNNPPILLSHRLAFQYLSCKNNPNLSVSPTKVCESFFTFDKNHSIRSIAGSARMGAVSMIAYRELEDLAVAFIFVDIQTAFEMVLARPIFRSIQPSTFLVDPSLKDYSQNNCPISRSSLFQ